MEKGTRGSRAWKKGTVISNKMDKTVIVSVEKNAQTPSL